MSNFVLAADPIRSWSTLLTGANPFHLRSMDDGSYILDGTVAGLPATIEIRGSGFGVRGAGLAAGTAQVNLVQYTVGGEGVMRTDGAVITGPLLTAWLRGDGNAFEQAVFGGDDLIVLSDSGEAQNGYGGDDAMHGRGGADMLLGSGGGDTLDGGEGDDRLDGGDGDDLVIGGWGDDSASGGADEDTFVAGALRRQVQVTVEAQQVALSGPQGHDGLTGFERIAFTDGVLHLDASSAAGQVWRLYGAAFGRDAETTGLSRWVGALDAGAASLADAANGFIGSAEFTHRYGQLDDAGFVARLYANVLGRAPDDAGLAAWTRQLAHGASRAEILLGFSESAEHKAATSAATFGRLWTVDADAMDVLRAYKTVLDRTPDAGGLAAWTEARHAGLGNADMLDGFIASPEFQTRFGALSNAEFVARMYAVALDRPADPNGLAAWTAALDQGAIHRHDVVQGFATSDEMTAKLLPLVEGGIVFA